MSTGTNQDWHRIGGEELRRSWIWFLLLGTILVIFGAVMLGWSILVTLASMVIFGWLLIFGGVLSIIHAFLRRRWGGFFLDLLAGILYFILGLLFVSRPGEAAVDLTLLIAVALVIGGIFRIITALTVHFHHWLWILFHGVISLLLGLMIWSQWPVSGLWVIGLFLGIDVVFYGMSLIMLALAVRSIPHPQV